MAYRDFDLATIKKEFDLIEKSARLFDDLKPVVSTDWLVETLKTGQHLALYSPSEKAKSEFIVAPILVEVQNKYQGEVALYSGRNLNADKSKGLNGECDFILCKEKYAHTIQTPIIGLVEAKRNDLQIGLGQCVAQMLGAQIINQQENNAIDTIFGCVTTGDIWLFLKLHNQTIFINNERYYIDNAGIILAAFQRIIAFYS